MHASDNCTNNIRNSKQSSHSKHSHLILLIKDIISNEDLSETLTSQTFHHIQQRLLLFQHALQPWLHI